MAASTALEALTAELLGDVGVLHDQVKALREVLPGVAQDVSDKLTVVTATLLAAAQAQRSSLEAVAQRIEDGAQQTAAITAETTRKELQQWVSQAVSASVRTELGSVVTVLEQASVQLSEQQAPGTQASGILSGWKRIGCQSALFGAGVLITLVLLVALQIGGIIRVTVGNLLPMDVKVATCSPSA